MKNSFESSTESVLDDNSKPAKILEALATELYALYCYGDYTRSQAFVQSASGENLEKLAELRGITRKTEQKAQGRLTFYLSEPAEKLTLIPKGIICSVSGKPYLQFITTSGTFMAAGQKSAMALAEAISPGSMYNVNPSEIDLMVNAPVGVAGVYNRDAFSGGYDTENDESLRMRVINRYAFDPCGIGARMLESAVINIEAVTDCFIPKAESFGKLEVYVATKNGYLEDTVKNKVKEVLSISELIGAELDIILAEEQKFSIDVRLKVRSGFDKTVIKQELKRIVNELYAQCRIGGAFSLEDIEKRALLIDGVLDASAQSKEAVSNTVYGGYGKKLIIKDLAVSYYEA